MAAQLRALMQRPGLLQAPGCYDAFSARLIEQAGFPVAYMTGFGSSASVLGMPDAGLILPRWPGMRAISHRRSRFR
jgi:2-methylisocitrate lyase-like PEP mutase family enzyme